MENMENEKPGQLPILEKNSEQTSHRKGNCTLVGQWMYIGLLMNDVWTWEMSMISNQLSEVQPPDTVRAALSGIQKKNVWLRGKGDWLVKMHGLLGGFVVETHGNFPALFFFPRDTVWNMDENSQFETWPFDGKWQIFWRHFLKAGLINTLLLPRIAVPVPGVKPSDFVWREMLDLFFGAKLIVFNESVFALMCTKWVEPTNSSTEGADKARNSGGWCQGGF